MVFLFTTYYFTWSTIIIIKASRFCAQKRKIKNKPDI